MRKRRAGRLGLDEADRLLGGDRVGPRSPGLDHLLDALQAPATTGEMSGEQATVAALAAERRRAVLSTRPEGSQRVPVSTSARTLVVSIVTGLALLGAGGTAVAARTGNLPANVQQHAHRLFSALGVPAPRTGPSEPAPAPAGPSVTPTATGSPTPAATITAGPRVQAAWCAAWRTAAEGGKPMNGRSRHDLIAVAGGQDNVARYCARLTASTPPATTTVPTAPGHASAPPHPTPSHPTPHATTPSHPGRNK
ncbi:hypothetical protein [Actinoplanes sp. NPDC051411]|uniref:hypothetical protein n=1 Tax=Actinoplanes sp. NPDC051411 TaxID=3155522 RepID=UPI003441A3A5